MSETAPELTKWLDSVSGPGWLWYAKYVAANDTYAKPNVHQGGPYVAKELLRTAFPVLTARSESEDNPDLFINVIMRSHPYVNDVRLVWYNSRIIERRANGRDEARLTQWGGRGVPLLEPNATGSLVLFAFHQPVSGKDAIGCEIWLCAAPDEEDVILDRIGPVEPGAGTIFSPGEFLPLAPPHLSDRPCALKASEVPPEWQDTFPSGEAIVERVAKHLPRSSQLGPDARLLKRRACEYEMFRSLESLLLLPRIRQGFDDVESFVAFAHSVTNRRKSRGGKSLELHAKAIFDEEQLPYSWGQPTENKRTPDFVFPSIDKYHDLKWSRAKLRVLAAKTTCKDRWRQVTTEAAQVPVKHLLTLQEGISADQHDEMREEGVVLVVPEPLQKHYPDEVRPHLESLSHFISETRTIAT